MPLSSKEIHDALRTVNDPELHRDLVSLNMVKDVQVSGDDVRLTIELTTPACPLKDTIKADIERALHSAAEDAGRKIGSIEIEFTADTRRLNERAKDKQSPLPIVNHIIAVGAGKGGVGKSTVAVTLAVGLARLGAKVGLLDGDIYGPSITTLLGLDDIAPKVRGETLLPFEIHGIKSMTIGKLVEPDKALIWRGPMAHGAFKQLALQTDWGALDYLIIDLPPGTGDVPLTMSQILPLSGAVIVCTPQKVAQDDARRAIRMFQKLGIDVLGVVENMSYFIGDDGKEYDIFGRGGAENMAAEMNIPFLGAIPIHMKMRENGDAGEPLKNWKISDELSGQLDALCKNLAGQISIATMSGKLVQPTLSVR
jgi:ATP-binding protein involved in chromosome partitioning